MQSISNLSVEGIYPQDLTLPESILTRTKQIGDRITTPFGSARVSHEEQTLSELELGSDPRVLFLLAYHFLKWAPSKNNVYFVDTSEKLDILATFAKTLSISFSRDSHLCLDRDNVMAKFVLVHDAPWHEPPLVPESVTEANNPVRPEKPPVGSVIYRRQSLRAKDEYSIIQLNAIKMDDLHLIHEWHNNPRVSVNWTESGDLDHHRKFIENGIKDLHTISVIVSLSIPLFDAVPMGYVEIYWAYEDRLGKLYDADPYDRGFHLLVGNEEHRGPHKVDLWMPSVVHFCFQSDARTKRVMCEPNERNTKVIRYLEKYGFKQHGTVTFPHKVSALMICERSDFIGFI